MSHPFTGEAEGAMVAFLPRKQMPEYALIFFQEVLLLINIHLLGRGAAYKRAAFYHLYSL